MEVKLTQADLDRLKAEYETARAKMEAAIVAHARKQGDWKKVKAAQSAEKSAREAYLRGIQTVHPWEPETIKAVKAGERRLVVGGVWQAGAVALRCPEAVAIADQKESVATADAERALHAVVAAIHSKAALN